MCVRIPCFLLLLVLTLAPWKPVDAALVINIGSTTISPGGTGTVDVTLSGGGENISEASFVFRITPVGGTRLEFLPANEGYLTNLASNYVFYNNSYKVNLPGNYGSVGDVDNLSDPRSRYSVFDGTDDFSFKSITSGVLLARLEFTANPGLGPLPQPGDQFTISADPDLTGSTYFTADTGEIPLGSLQVNSGTITIAPVPEPGTVAALASGGLLAAGSLWYRRRKRKKAQAAGPAQVQPSAESTSPLPRETAPPRQAAPTLQAALRQPTTRYRVPAGAVRPVLMRRLPR